MLPSQTQRTPPHFSCYNGCMHSSSLYPGLLPVAIYCEPLSLSLSLSLHGFLASAFKTHRLPLLFIPPDPFSSHFSFLGVLLLAMKTSSPSSSATATTISILRTFALIAVFLSATSCIWLSEASLPHEAFSGPLCDRHRHRLHHRRSYHHHHAENSFSAWHPPPSWCLPFPRGRLQPPLPPTEEEIDPRYGVKKRLVPTGPNPLHN